MYLNVYVKLCATVLKVTQQLQILATNRKRLNVKYLSSCRTSNKLPFGINSVTMQTLGTLEQQPINKTM